MKITIGIAWDDIIDEIRSELAIKAEHYYKDTADALLKSFDENFGGGFIDATFELEISDDETEVTSCMLVGG